MPRAVSPSPRALRLAFVASLALFARVLDAARADKQSNETLDPLAGLRAHPELPRELRLPLSVASAALADAGLAPRAADAIARYGGADRAARDLTLVLAAATAACGDGREEATDALASSSAAAARAGPLRALFSGLTHELELRTRVTKELDELSASRLLSAEESYDVRVDERSGARFVVDALDEAEASLARAGGDGGGSSCFAGAGGIVTRTLRALGILAEDLEAVVTTLRQRSAEELRECGLGASALDAKENDSDDSDDDDDSETAADVETLAYFAARAETCRRRGRGERSADLATFASVKTISEMPEEGKKDRLRRLSARVLASHLALADATRAEARAAEIRADGYAKGLLRTCLGDSFPPPDPRWDAPAGASLLTSTGALAFVVAALGDVTLSESACQRALDSPPGVFFASPALDAVAQEAAEAGVFPAVAAWLAASPSGSAGLEASVDEVQAAARACAINAAAKKTANEKKSWIVVERGPTDAALSFLRRLEAATLGRRGGRRGYSAVGKLVRALETLVEKLESGGCIDNASEIASVEPVEPSKRAEEPGSVKAKQSGSVETAVPARTTSRAAADFARRDDADADAEVLADPRGFPRGSSPGGASFATTSDIVLGVLFGVAAFALVVAAAGAVASRRGARSAARKRRASASSPRGASASGSAGADRLGSDRSSLLGGGAAGSARRFYRHLEAGSAGDLPLVEDLDRVASLPGARSPAASGSPSSESPRASTPPSGPYASQFFAPASRRRSHSISEPAAARAQLPPRHERRHTTRAEDV